MPFERTRSPPFWKPFSITIPAPAILAPAPFTMSIRPSKAQPFARKSSIISTLSSGDRNFLLTITLYVRLCVKLSIEVEYTSPSMFTLCAFFANTTGHPKYCAVTHAMPMPDASIVSILFMLLSGNSLRNSLPISL